MMDREQNAHRLVGYLEAAMEEIERLCNVPTKTALEKAHVLLEIERIATRSIETAKERT